MSTDFRPHCPLCHCSYCSWHCATRYEWIILYLFFRDVFECLLQVIKFSNLLGKIWNSHCSKVFIFYSCVNVFLSLNFFKNNLLNIQNWWRWNFHRFSKIVVLFFTFQTCSNFSLKIYKTGRDHSILVFIPTPSPMVTKFQMPMGRPTAVIETARNTV